MHFLQKLDFQSVARIGMLGSALLLAGCTQPRPSDYVTGKVVGEYGVLSRLHGPSRSFTVEPVTLGEPRYGLVVKTNQGDYSMMLEELLGDTEHVHSVYGLSRKVDEGTTVRFPLVSSFGDSYFVDGEGIVDPDNIEVITD